MAARAIVMPPDGAAALRRRLGILAGRGPVLVVACRGPLGTMAQIVSEGIDLENVVILDARSGPGPDEVPILEHALHPGTARATFLVHDLAGLFSLPDPKETIHRVREVREALFPGGADIEYVTSCGDVAPDEWDMVCNTVDEVLPLLDSGRLERLSWPGRP